MTEYAQVFDSEQSGFSGRVGSQETVRVMFPAVKARFVKITFQRAGAAIGELGVFLVKPSQLGESPSRTPRPADTVAALPTSTRLATGTVLGLPTDTGLPTQTLVGSPAASEVPTATAVPTLTDTLPASDTPLPPPSDTATSAPTQPIQAPPTDTAPPPTVQPLLSLGPIEVSGHDQNLVFTCAGNAVEVRGSGNVVTLLGSCSSITVTGNGNQVFWQFGDPIIMDQGNDNLIGQQ
jgi:hypothetical protein